jgi:uncharacterized membrane protein
MRPASYFLAIATGKFVRFLIESILVIVYGPAILETSLRMLHRHLGGVLGVMGFVAVGIVVYVLRRVFDRRRGIALPVEENEAIEIGPGDAL